MCCCVFICVHAGVLEAFNAAQRMYFRRLYVAQQVAKGEQREELRRYSFVCACVCARLCVFLSVCVCVLVCVCALGFCAGHRRL
jgi:hypothetical protein